MKNKLINTLFITVVLLHCIYALPVLPVDISTNNAVIINNTSVPVEEFMLIAGSKKALVHDYFRKKYDARSTNIFWETRFGDETPLMKLTEMVVKELVNIKIIQQRAQQYGLLPDISYEAFLGRWQKENMRRKRAIEMKEVIYGPIQYSREVYYDYVNSNLSVDIFNRKLSRFSFQREQ
jgi:hypothetical protein